MFSTLLLMETVAAPISSRKRQSVWDKPAALTPTALLITASAKLRTKMAFVCSLPRTPNVNHQFNALQVSVFRVIVQRSPMVQLAFLRPNAKIIRSAPLLFRISIVGLLMSAQTLTVLHKLAAHAQIVINAFQVIVHPRAQFSREFAKATQVVLAAPQLANVPTIIARPV